MRLLFTSAKAALPTKPHPFRLGFLRNTRCGLNLTVAPRNFGLTEYIAQTYALYASVPKTFFEQKGIQRVAAVLS